MKTFMGSCARSAIRGCRVWTRWRFAPLLIVGLLMLACVAPVKGQSRDLQDLSAQLAQKITKSGKKSIAVVDFTDLQGNVTELGRFLAEELSVSLSQQANGFTIIDRTYLKAILREHKLAATGLIDPETASKLGQIAGVQGLVTGTIVPLGDNVSLSVKVLDATTEAIIAATITQIPRTEAINTLLKTSISGGSNGSSTSESEAGPESQQGISSGSQPTGAVVVHGEDLDFIVKACRRQRGRVLCVGSITNKTSGELSVDIREAYVLDNMGNQSQIDLYRQLVLGARGFSQQMEPDLPMNFSVWTEYGTQSASGGSGLGPVAAAIAPGVGGGAGGIDPRATSVSIVLKGYYQGQQIGGRPYTVTLRHVPIQER